MDFGAKRWRDDRGATSGPVAGPASFAFRLGRTVGYRRLRALVDHDLLSRSRLVHGQPTLYVATREGLTWAGMPQVEPARIGVSTTALDVLRPTGGDPRARQRRARDVGRAAAPRRRATRRRFKSCLPTRREARSAQRWAGRASRDHDSAHAGLLASPASVTASEQDRGGRPEPAPRARSIGTSPSSSSWRQRPELDRARSGSAHDVPLGWSRTFVQPSSRRSKWSYPSGAWSRWRWCETMNEGCALPAWIRLRRCRL